MRPSEDYVLKPFPVKFKELIKEVVDNAVDGINYYSEHSINETMNKYNKKDDRNGE